MLYSITDIGSNTVKMHIFDMLHDDTSKIRPIFSESITLGLGALRENGCLKEEGIDLLCEALIKYKFDSENFGSNMFFAFATASIRNISNTDEVAKKVLDKTGISIDVLSGEDEARLSFIGMRTEYPNAESGRAIDMGGGSTEIISFNRISPFSSVSLPFGCVTLRSDFVKSGPFPNIDEQSAIAEYIDKTLERIKQPNYVSDLYLIGGTARALFKLALSYRAVNLKIKKSASQKHIGKTENITLLGKKFPFRYNYKESVHEHHSMMASEYSDIFDIFTQSYQDNFISALIESIVPERRDTVIPGMIAIDRIRKLYGIKKLHLVTSGVREGYLNQLSSKKV